MTDINHIKTLPQSLNATLPVAESLESWLKISTRVNKDWAGDVDANALAIKTLLDKAIGSKPSQVMFPPMQGSGKPWNPSGAKEGPTLLHEFNATDKAPAKIRQVVEKYQKRFSY